MRVLILAKMDRHDQIVENFARKYFTSDYEIHLLNVVPIPSEIPLKMNGEVIDVCTEYDLTKYYSKQKENQTSLSDFLEEIPSLKRQSLIGDPLSIIKSYVRENGIELVLSGGHITTHKEDLLLNTFSNQLMQQLPVPYLSIKGNGDEFEIGNIALVREFVDPTVRNLDFIKKLSDQFNIKILLVKINTPNSFTEENELRHKMDEYARLNDLSNFECVTIEGSDKESAIRQMVESHNVGILALGHLDRNGTSFFLRGDLRSDVLNHINVPIYIY